MKISSLSPTYFYHKEQRVKAQQKINFGWDYNDFEDRIIDDVFNHFIKANIPVSAPGEPEDGYYPAEIEAAQTYRYVKNPEKLLKEDYDYWDYDQRQSVLELIEKYKKRDEAIRRGLSSNEQIIANADKEQKTLEGSSAKLDYEVKKIRQKTKQEGIQIARTLCKLKRKQKVCEELNPAYLDLIKLKARELPNGIIIKGIDTRQEQKDVVGHFYGKGCIVHEMDFNDIPLSQITKKWNEEMSQECEDDEPKILIVYNFGRYAVETEENTKFISKMKSSLSRCGEQNITVLIFENNPERFEKALISKHRFNEIIDARDIKEEDYYDFPDEDIVLPGRDPGGQVCLSTVSYLQNGIPVMHQNFFVLKSTTPEGKDREINDYLFN